MFQVTQAYYVKMYKILEAMITKRKSALRLSLYTIPDSSAAVCHGQETATPALLPSPIKRRVGWNTADEDLVTTWVASHGVSQWAECEGHSLTLSLSPKGKGGGGRLCVVDALRGKLSSPRTNKQLMDKYLTFCFIRDDV